MKYEKLFSPIKIRNMEIKNRLVVPAMGTNQCNKDNSVSDRLVEYWATRARGGWGLCIVEVTAVASNGLASECVPAIYDDKYIPGMKRLADEVHKSGSKIAIQLHHAGRQTDPRFAEGQLVAASPVKCPTIQVMPHELTTEEVYDMIEKFGDAAVRARKAGIDCVEVHGAHGYLLANFMSPHSNKRLDEFGGSFNNRMRFPVEVIRNIKRKAGNDYPVIFRLSGVENVPGGHSLEESKVVARIMEDAGADCIHVSTGSYGSVTDIVAPSSYPDGFILNHAAEIRKVVKVPVIGTGRVYHPVMADNAIMTGQADMISMGRQSLADPEFPNKVFADCLDEIAPCVACMQGCLGNTIPIGDVLTAACMVNAFCCREVDHLDAPAKIKKKVTVVGAGPAGLEAAWVAAKRGHDVTLYEKQSVIGGNYRIGGIPPYKQLVFSVLQYYKTMGDKYGVKYRIQEEATAEKILAEQPDEVIIATGSVPIIPNIPGLDQVNYMTAEEVLEGTKEPVGKVLIVGGSSVGCEIADFLGEYGHDITVMDMLPTLGTGLESAILKTMFERLKKYEVKMMPNTKLKEFANNQVITEVCGEEKVLSGFDTVVIAVGYKSLNNLEEQLKDKVSVHVIGDAKEARTAYVAIHEGAAIAAEI